MPPLGEFEIIKRFFEPLARATPIGLVDDVAILPETKEGQRVFVTKDVLAEGVHFLPDDPPDTVARKALRVNVSDLVAKGVIPKYYLLGLGMTERVDEAWLEAFAAGLALDQEIYGVDLVGGDTIRAGDRIVVSITAIGVGSVATTAFRFAGKADEAVYVTGEVGSAAIGLALARGEKGPWNKLDKTAKARLLGRYRLPEPRYGLMPVLWDFARASMDVSDGLVGDLDKLSAASGVTAELDADLVPLDPALEPFRGDEALIARLITGGDDYEVLCSVPEDTAGLFEDASARAGIRVTRVGRLVAGSGLVRVSRAGQPMRIAGRSYAH